MKLRFSNYLLFFASFTIPAYADQWIGIGLNHSKQVLYYHKSELEEEGHTVKILNDYTGKFENDNTFVQLNHPDYNKERISLTYKNVFISLPQRLDADSLIEALIKVRAARTFGANLISIRCENELEKIQIQHPLGGELVLDDLFSVAGADFVIERNKKRSLKHRIPTKSIASQSDFWIGGAHQSSLLNEVAEQLGKSPTDFSKMQGNRDALEGKIVYWFSDFSPPVNENLITTLAQIQWMKKHGAFVHLISPYLIYARSDKPEFSVGTTTQGRLMADLIESVGTQGITVVRAHAPQSLGFFKIHSNEISARSTIVNFLKSQQVECVISPDAGFQKDASKYQLDLKETYGGERSVCLAVMNKERNSDGKEKILGGTGLESVRGKQIVIIDDETSSGGTLSQVAQVLQSYQPKSIFAVVTHLAGPAQKALSSDFIQRLIVTNSVPVKVSHPKLTVLSIAREIAEEISDAEKNRKILN